MGGLWSILFGSGTSATHHNAVGGDLSEDMSSDVSLVSVHNTGGGSGTSPLTYLFYTIVASGVVITLMWLYAIGCLKPLFQPCVDRFRRCQERHAERRRSDIAHRAHVRRIAGHLQPHPPPLPPVPHDLVGRL